MKKILYTLSALFLSLSLYAQPKAKYIFYFIGDGMGVNQVGGAETYLAAVQNRIGITPLCFTQFPYLALSTTYSATNGVTDSAAGGTALSCGIKTKNGAIGMEQDLLTPRPSIATVAKEHGAAVGIATSVSIDHATPAVFYAHVPHRSQYYDIGKQLPASNFDFFAGSDFRNPLPDKTQKNIFDSSKGGKENLYRIAERQGYRIVRGYDEYLQKAPKTDKIILFQPLKDSQYYRDTLPYKLDQKSDNLTLPQITAAGINFLTSCQQRHKNPETGFFFMIEGGMIDMACHSNDAACYIGELLDMDACVQQAYQFYLQHPDSTLIVVTADHETGGLSLGRGAYALHMDKLQHQKVSCYDYSKYLDREIAQQGTAFSWEWLRDDLTKNFGFWTKISLSEKQEKRLKNAYQNIMKGIHNNKKSLYAEENEISYVASEIMNEVAGLSWASNGHSNGFVGVYAIGAGADKFQGQIENKDIPRLIREAAGWQ